MTRVLFHSLTIPPDNVSTGKLVADIANKFSENGQHIEILHLLLNIILMKMFLIMN